MSLDLEHDDGAAAAADLASSTTDEANASGPLKRDLVAGLEKGLAVIEAFDQDRPRLTISEVAACTGLTRAAARRYLLTLAHLGFVTQDRKMFSLAPKVLRLGHSYLHSARLPRIVEPELHKLALAVKEGSLAAVLDNSDVICIASTTGGRVVHSPPIPGTRAPAHCTGTGRVILSALPQAEFDAWVSQRPLAAYTPHTVTQAERLSNELARVRAQGYAVVDQELELGLRTLAVPLRNYRGDIVAAMHVSTHASRMSVEQLVEMCLPPLLQAQAHLRMLL